MVTNYTTMQWNEAQLKNFFLEMISCSDEGMAVKQIEEVFNNEYQPVRSEYLWNLAEKLQNSGYITLGFRNAQAGKTYTAIITRAGERLLNEGGFQ